MAQQLPEVGDLAPDFTLTDDSGRHVRLSERRGRKVILYFYPAAMTPGCTTQAVDFTAAMDDLAAEGYDVLAVSPDSPDKLARFRERDALTVVLLSDPDKKVLTAYGAFGEKKNYGRIVQGVIRSTMVIDEEGRLTHVQRNVRAKGHVDKLRRDLGLA